MSDEVQPVAKTLSDKNLATVQAISNGKVLLSDLSRKTLTALWQHYVKESWDTGLRPPGKDPVPFPLREEMLRSELERRNTLLTTYLVIGLAALQVILALFPLLPGKPSAAGPQHAAAGFHESPHPPEKD